MTTIDHAKSLRSLVRTLKGSYEADASLAERSALEELVYAFLLWEAPSVKADAAYKRLVHQMVDMNELRVCRWSEVASIIGKTYPLVEERSQRLKASLHELYLREYAVTLDKCAALSKRDARKYLDTLEGMTPFVAARVVLTRLGGHAIPVDERLLGRLVAEEVVEPDFDCAKAEGVLERNIKADDALEMHLLLQAWCDDPASEPKKSRVKKPEAEEPASAKSSKPKSSKPRA